MAALFREQPVVDGDPLELLVGEDRLHELTERFVERLRAAAGVCKQHSATVEVLAQLLFLIVVHGETIASVHVEDRVLEDVGIGEGQLTRFG